MITIDQLLLQLVQHTAPTLEECVSKRDAKVLRSLASTVSSPNFITENQSRLLIKIMKENQSKLGKMHSDTSLILEVNTWSKMFRPVDKTKRLYISPSADGDLQLVMEFAFSNAIRKNIGELAGKVTGLVQDKPGRLYHADLSETNIVTLVHLCTRLDFTIDEKLKNYYEIIKSWSEEETKRQFLISNISHSNFQKHITADLGLETAIDKNIIADRSMRYQYFTENYLNFGENLTEKIANRSSTKVWVNKKEVALDEIINSLIELRRLPCLVVFDSYDDKKCLIELENLVDSLEKNRIFDGVGIYFRLDNTDIGKQFNQLIADKSYNTQLGSNTVFAGVQSGKIPKFFLKNDWQPMSVISIGNPLRHSKTAVYASVCDLVITYTDSEPIVESRAAWA